MTAKVTEETTKKNDNAERGEKSTTSKAMNKRWLRKRQKTTRKWRENVDVESDEKGRLRSGEKTTFVAFDVVIFFVAFEVIVYSWNSTFDVIFFFDFVVISFIAFDVVAFLSLLNLGGFFCHFPRRYTFHGLPLLRVPWAVKKVSSMLHKII